MAMVNEIRGLAEYEAKAVSGSPRNWMGYLNTAARLYRYSFPDTLLIHAQRPDATACASLELWNGRMNRWVNRGAKGIALIDDTGPRRRLKYVFDISDTHMGNGGRTPNLWKIEDRHQAEILAHLLDTYGLPEKEAPDLQSALWLVSSQLADESLEEMMDGLFYETEGTFLDGLDENTIRVEFRSLLINSAFYTMSARCGLDPMEYLEEEDFSGITDYNALSVLTFLGNATSQLTEPVLVDIGRTVRRILIEESQKSVAKENRIGYNKFNALKHESNNREGGKEHGIDLPPQRGLPVPEPDNRGAGGSHREVRDAAPNIPEGEPEGMVPEHDAVGETGQSPDGDREGSDGEDGNPDERAASEIPGPGQGERPDGVGSAYEWTDGNGGREHLEGIGIQLNEETTEQDLSEAEEIEAAALSLPDFPTVEQQKRKIEERMQALYNLAVQYAYKLDNPGDTRELVKKLAEATENPEAHNIQEVMEDAQAEIDFLPDNQIGLMQMHDFGYRNDSVLPLKVERAVALHNAGLNIYSLNKDGSRTLMNTEADIRGQDGIFGIEGREWESYRVMEAVREENGEQGHLNEDLFFNSNQDSYAIYQIKDDSKGREYLFMGTEYLKKQGLSAEYDDYQMVYSDVLGEDETLDSLYEKFNIRRPLDFMGHSLSVSDVVALKKDGEISAHYVDSFGYTELPGFFFQREKSRDQGKEAEAGQTAPGGKMYPPFYMHTLSYAMEHGRADDYLESRKLNLDCKRAIEDTIRNNFDGMHLAHDAAGEVLEEYGAERVVFILANTVQQLEHDGRFSIGNKAWAKGYKIPENVSRGMDLNADYVVSSHPAVLDGFIGLVREGIREQELGKEENVQINEETEGFIADGHFGTWHTAEMKEISGELFYRMEHEEYGDSVASIIVSQEGKLVAEDLEHGFDVGAMEAIGEYFSEKGIEMEPELSFIAQYYVMQNAEGGKAEREYQYFQDIDTAVTAYHQIPNHLDKRLGMESTEQPPSRMSLIECRNGIETLTDIEKYSLSGKWVRGETMKASQKAKEYLDNCDSEIAYQTGRGYFSIQTVSDGYDYTIYGKDFREIDGGVYDNPDITIGEAMEAILSDKGIQVALCKVMDYEELQEKAEAAAQEDIQKAQAEEKEKLPLISDRTEPEPALNGQSRAGIEETVLCYAQAQIDEMGLAEEVELLGARVYGSHSREGLYHEESDIDVVVSYNGSLREDAFFNALHEDGLKIAGIPVDINPISAEKTGTLEEYLENAEKYLDEKQSRMEIPENEQGGQTGQEAAITFYVAECTEFPVLGEYHERLETLQEAMELYEKIPAERMNGVKGIGFRLEDGSIYDGNLDLMVMGEIQTEFINEIPQYRESPLVQKAISDMEEILSKQKERDVSEPERKPEPPQHPAPEENRGQTVQTDRNMASDRTVQESREGAAPSEKKSQEPEKTAENVPKTGRELSGGGRKQSVLNALRERQARMKAQEKEKQGQEKTARKKGEQEL